MPALAPARPGPKKTGELSKDTATGVAILKGQNDPPLKADSEYPAWLFKLLETEATVVELQRAYEGPGLTLSQVRSAPLRCSAAARALQARGWRGGGAASANATNSLRATINYALAGAATANPQQRGKAAAATAES